MPTGLGIVRQGITRNIGRKINPANMSYHPLAAPNRNVRMPGHGKCYMTCHNTDHNPASY